MSSEKDSPIALPRRQHRIVLDAVERWAGGGILDRATADKLRASMVALPFDWQRTARYAFIVSIACAVIAIGALLADKLLMTLLLRIFHAPAAVKCGFFAAAAAGIFSLGLFLRRRHPARVYSNEAVFFLGVLAVATAIYFLGVAIDTGTQHYSVLFLIASLLYALLGLWFPSKLVWVFGLISLGAWMGTETGYVSGHGMYFLGMSYPLRFVLFGAVLAGLGIAGERALASGASAAPGNIRERWLFVSPQTKVIGLIDLFIALWIMSIFGNYGDMTVWRSVPQYELVHWSVLFGLVAAGAVWYGLRHDDGVLRGFGLTFLFINLYTRFFEYFWDSLHKAVFFALLAVSLWYLGRKAEAIWNIGRAPQELAGFGER